ncbi:MAG: FkbM family methyltransferase [Sphingobacteriaceae bacterium]|nr:FkbM family methyltransferase [Sphingobacteriaceae bacterium]
MNQILKSFYRIIPFKREIYSVLKIFWRPKESVYKHLYFKQAFQVKINHTKKFKIHNGYQLENEIFWEGLTGKWEKESIKLWMRLCEFSNHIYDIGANTGIYALIAKTINPNAKVYAFEPQPLFFKLLQKNIELNNYDIKAYRNAVSNLDGNIVIEDYLIENHTINVEALQLDSFVQKNNLKSIDLLKIDVEAHEPQVLEGFMKNLAQFKPTFLIEVLNEAVADYIYHAVNKYEYLYFNIDENKGIRQTKKIEKSDYLNYLLCSKETAKKLGLTIDP